MQGGGKEVWRDIPGFDFPYQVSNLGRTKTLPILKRSRSWDGAKSYWTKERIHRHSVDKAGYHRVGLYKNKRQIGYSVHRIVASVFIANPDGYPVVNHKNGNKSDNRTKNLEWCTHRQNEDHATANGLKARGSRHGMALLNEEDIPLIRKRLAMRPTTGETQVSIAKDFGVQPHVIYAIASGQCWRHVKEDD